MTVTTTPLLSESSEILKRLWSAPEVVLALDFDGTLAPIAPTPDLAVMPRETAGLLRELTVSHHCRVVILSGRSIEDLRSKVPFDCILVGNHGLEISGGGFDFIHQGAFHLRPAIECICVDLRDMLAGVNGVVVEDKQLSATVHYRNAPTDLIDWIEATIHLVMRPYKEWLILKPARKAWELRPRVTWNKGAALNLLLGALGVSASSVICAGDDLTDEDMFRLLPDSISIQVGGRIPTAARYHVAGPPELASFLASLTAVAAR